ncbi:hypothetical protein AX17_004202, partial [Amanita inopinata Kibby_2008]
MANSFTSAVLRARDVFDRNLIKRGQSRDSEETDDSPFGSSLVTPVNEDGSGVDIVGSSGSAVLRLFTSTGKGEGDASLIDYFGLKKGDPPASTRALEPSMEVDSPSSTRAVRSSGFSTPGTPAYETRMRKKSIYNLPNRPIGAEETSLVCTEQESVDDLSASLDARNISYTSDDEFHARTIAKTDADLDELFGCAISDLEEENPLWFLSSLTLSSSNLVTCLVRIILFVPWCISVGGSMLLWPDKLDAVAFQTGYVDSLQGIRRFAHWSDVGLQFVLIFMAFLVCLLWALPATLGLLLVLA